MVVTVLEEELSSSLSSMCSFAAESTVPNNYWTERPPSSYSLKTQNLAQFVGENYQSRRFLADGHNWRLIIYPKGNEKDNGSGFISMYVEIDSKSEVFAYLTFFVYNKKANKYMCIQDAEVKRFNALKKVWGISQVIPLVIFNDPKIGYIFDGDQCEFGVDIMLDTPLTNWEVVSFNDKKLLLPNPNFTWTVKDFSNKLKELYISNRFSVGGKTWVLKLYPKCFSTSDGKWISIFLHLADNERLMADERIYTRGQLRVLDPFGSNHVTEKFICWHDESNSGCGHDKIVSTAMLREAYLDKEDTLSVVIEFEVVSSTNYSPII